MIYPEDYRFFHELDKPRKLEFDDIAIILVVIGIVAVLICAIFI
ncbi:hypothetical protein LCGC14_0797450 [marine sediment metagenome]|uniref:Uncharacterized protein n=1 Tax=marine sediment metagenome TaxID=412755 RepID=A0A0F9PV55_9ZZZZ